MLYGITLPSYQILERFEGKGNYAIKKYYKFPFNLFYVYKLKMIKNLLNRKYKTCMDFGSGPGIFTPELRKVSEKVLSFDKPMASDPRWKFDLIICASVLEFLGPQLSSTLMLLKSFLNNKGELIVCSPMDTWITRLYFRLIGDKNKRRSHNDIIKFIKWKMKIKYYREWLGIYFVCKATL